MSTWWACPECRQNKHPNCTRTVLDTADTWRRCPCMGNGHTNPEVMMDSEPVLPYTGTQGHSGTDTSRERAETEASDGTARDRQTRTLALLADRGYAGMTVIELRNATGWHHGKASSVLSVLHKVGKIDCLEASRNRSHVYVLVENTRGRPTRPHGRKTTGLNDEEKAALHTVKHDCYEANYEDHVVDADALVKVITALERYL